VKEKLVVKLGVHVLVHAEAPVALGHTQLQGRREGVIKWLSEGLCGMWECGVCVCVCVLCACVWHVSRA